MEQRPGTVQGLAESDLSDEEDDASNSKRARREEDEEFKVRLKEDGGRFAPPRKAQKDRPRQRVQCGISVNLSLMTTAEIVESGTFRRLSEMVSDLLELVDDAELKAAEADSEELPDELKIPADKLTELCSEAAKVKAVRVMQELPVSKLVKLLQVLLVNMRDGAKVIPLSKPGAEDDSENRLWRDLYMEKVMRSIEAALTAMHIMTSPNMPKEVFLEDVIEKAVGIVRFQLNNTVYPESDPVYRRADTGTGTQQSIRNQRQKERPRPKLATHLLNRIVELVDCFAQLVVIQRLTDNLVLALSSLSVASFFVENVEQLQLSSLKLTTAIFSRYDKHRQLILEDLFAPLAKLPSSKRSLRTYRLNTEDSIQMLCALSLLLVQSVVRLPVKQAKTKDQENEMALQLMGNYDDAVRISQYFLTVFLKKSVQKGEEQDFRSIFEKFVEDLLVTVNKPEWPAAELFLSLLGSLLVKRFANKGTDQNTRVTSLDYLGTIAARLRKDAVSSQMNEHDLDAIVRDMKDFSRGLDKDLKETQENEEADISREERVSMLQTSMLDYLSAEDSDLTFQYSAHFYLSQWFKDCSVECEKMIRQQKNASSNDESAEAQEELEKLEARKLVLMNKAVEQFEQEQTRKRVSKHDTYVLEYEDACLVSRYLASMRPFSHSFDVYLAQILKVLNEPSVAVRTKAIKCLTAVVEVDPSILERTDIEKNVHGRLLDNSTSVREAVIELIGKFVIIRPQLTPQYYPMLATRILDTGVSVRKRVIKIFREICLEQPDFNKIPEMCIKMIRRVNDEEGIRKLVNEVFQSMWFTPVKDTQTVKLLQRVGNITDVVAACKDTGYEWFESLLKSLLEKEDKEEKGKPVDKACRQLVDALVSNIMRLEEVSSNNNSRLVACLCTMYMFCKIKPSLMIDHAHTIQSYLKIKISTNQDNYVLHYVARILELTVPLIDHPNEQELQTIEDEMVQLTMKKGAMVLDSAVACLSSIVNKVTKHYNLIRDCFNLFFSPIDILQQQVRTPGLKQFDPVQRPCILRGLYTVGLLLKHFDLSNITDYQTDAIRDRVFDSFMFFCSSCSDPDFAKKALAGLGFMCVRHSELLLQDRLRTFYSQIITSPRESVDSKTLVLKNLTAFLLEEESTMSSADSHWKELEHGESLKEMHDVQSGRSSVVAQSYLDDVLQTFYHPDSSVRLAGLTLVTTILRQGLIHPVKTVAHLISLQSDSEEQVRSRADSQLRDIDKFYPSFINMRALLGIRQSFQLQQVMLSTKIVRGFRETAAGPVALNHTLFAMLRTNRNNRRCILLNMVNLFDESHVSEGQRCTLAELLYVADNLSSFSYQVMEEPLYIIHQLDLLVSVSGSSILTNIKDYLGFAPGTELPEGCTPEMLATRIPAIATPVVTWLRLSKGITLLLALKQYLKDAFGIADAKIQNYSPSDAAKQWERPLTRRATAVFTPQRCLEALQAEQENRKISLVQLAAEILDLEDVMLSIDSGDVGSGAEDEAGKAAKSGEDGAQQPRQVPHHPAVENASRLKIHLTRLEDIDGVQRPQKDGQEEVYEDEGHDSDDSRSQGPRLKMPRAKKKQRSRAKKKYVSESESVSSLSSDSLSD